MRYKYFAKVFSTAALAGALTLSAAPQAGNLNDPEDQMYSDQQPAVVQQTTTTVSTTMSDHEIRHEIRKAIVHDVTMSNRARFVRIMCRNGEVTLKGSLPTTMEKQKILDKAHELAGNNVVDQLKVKHRNFIG